MSSGTDSGPTDTQGWLEAWRKARHDGNDQQAPDFDFLKPSHVDLDVGRDSCLSPKRILVIAGSDSSGGAGLEADQKVIAAHKCYSMTATTALTAQDTMGVYDIHHIPPPFVARQINTCLDDIGVDVVKIGMLASTDTVRIVAETLRKRAEQFDIVVDPVMVSTSGAQLLPQDAVSSLRDLLLPQATIVTPNIPEAKLLLGSEATPRTTGDMIDLAKKLHKLGPKCVLVKGGHFQLDVSDRETQGDHRIVDVFFDGHRPMLIEKPLLRSKNTHGTGCSLASAIASNLALKLSIHEAVYWACCYVETGIRLSIDSGRGNGPINHFHSSSKLPFVPGRFVEYALLKSGLRPLETQNDRFFTSLANGTLKLENFHELIERYHNALLALKHTEASLDRLAMYPSSIPELQRHIDSHHACCKSFHLSPRELPEVWQDKPTAPQVLIDNSSIDPPGIWKTNPEEEPQYFRWNLYRLKNRQWFSTQVTLLPWWICQSMAARYLRRSLSDNLSSPYRPWVEEFVRHTAVNLRDTIEQLMMSESLNNINILAADFADAYKLVLSFWSWMKTD